MTLGLTRRILLTGLAFQAAALGARAQERDAGELWLQLRAGGRVVLLRHAQTVPGFGDPPEFRVNDCTTQRNLSEEGRLQAAQIGATLRDMQVPIAEVWSSRWCRCVDTALLAFDRATLTAALDSLFGAVAEEKQRRTAALRERVAKPVTAGNLVLVTHHENILQLTGQAIGPGEALVLNPRPPDGFTIEGRLTVRVLLGGERR